MDTLVNHILKRLQPHLCHNDVPIKVASSRRRDLPRMCQQLGRIPSNPHTVARRRQLIVTVIRPEHLRGCTQRTSLLRTQLRRQLMNEGNRTWCSPIRSSGQIAGRLQVRVQVSATRRTVQQRAMDCNIRAYPATPPTPSHLYLRRNLPPRASQSGVGVEAHCGGRPFLQSRNLKRVQRPP